MGNITQLPPPPKPPELLVGPFEEWRVVVDGREIPKLTGFRDSEGVWLVVDRRFACGPFTDETAYQAAVCAGQAMAVASGYSHLGAETKDRPFAPIVRSIEPP